MSGLTSLEELDLSDTSVSGAGLRHLSKMKQLQSLDISYSGLQDPVLGNMAVLCTWIRMTDGVLCHAAGVTDEGLHHLSVLTSLTRLNADNRTISDEGARLLASLVSLQHLDLFGAKITDSGCVHLRRAPGPCQDSPACCIGLPPA